MTRGLTPDGIRKKVDIDTMHANRDAIRDDQGRRVVEYAATLYPGPELRLAEGLEALQAVPEREPGLEARLREIFNDALAREE